MFWRKRKKDTQVSGDDATLVSVGDSILDKECALVVGVAEWDDPHIRNQKCKLRISIAPHQRNTEPDTQLPWGVYWERLDHKDRVVKTNRGAILDCYDSAALKGIVWLRAYLDIQPPANVSITDSFYDFWNDYFFDEG